MGDLVTPWGSSAHLSPCRAYRYHLTRSWAGPGRSVCWVMLNPSTADASADDPTIRRCIRFSQRWRFDSLSVVNLYAFRATDPRELATAVDPVGPDNDAFIRAAAAAADLVVCAWGATPAPDKAARVAAVLRVLESPHALALTKDGEPRHPLYLRRDLRPVPLEVAP